VSPGLASRVKEGGETTIVTEAGVGVAEGAGEAAWTRGKDVRYQTKDVSNAVILQKFWNLESNI
jgi:hypothetical protein